MRLILAPAFATALMVAFAATWLALGRHWSASITLSTILIGVAGLCGGLATRWILARVPVRPRSARQALAALTLLSVTAGTLTLCIALADIILSPGEPPEGLAHKAIWIVMTIAASFYLMLGVAARLLLPPGLILIALFSWAYARAMR